MAEFVRYMGQLWLFIAAAGLIFRTVQLFVIKDIQTGLVWMTKILTDLLQAASKICRRL
jgi:hypothetical protein